MTKKRRLSQRDVVEYLWKHAGATESEIQEGAWGYYRNTTNEANKKYADVLRRAMAKNKVVRFAHKVGRSEYIYFATPEALKDLLTLYI